MENLPQHLEKTESFSYRWLATPNNNTNTNNAISSISHKTEGESSPNFDFETSPMPEFSLVHADILFSNGVIKSQGFLNNNNTSKIDKDITISPSSSSFIQSEVYLHAEGVGIQGIFPRKWGKLPRKIVSKCLGCCFVPVNKTRGGIRVDDINSFSNSNSSNSPERSSPRVRKQSCGWSDSDESYIHEAILYCKQSNALCT